jgi:hypothetical protein
LRTIFLLNAAILRTFYQTTLNSIATTLQYIREKGIVSTFPNIDIAFRIFLGIAVTNCSAERSFSLLKRIKNPLSNSLGEERLG